VPRRARTSPASPSDSPAPPRPPRSAYVDGLRLLAGRELSERQVRDRLLRRGHAEADVDEAIGKLKDQRAIDDARAAEAWARAALSGRMKGRGRIARELARAGIGDDLVRQTLAALFQDVDEDRLVVAALARRLRGRPLSTDRKAVQRIVRYLVGQGFSIDAVLRAIKRPFDRIDDHDVE
jgi:regulatory protein